MSSADSGTAPDELAQFLQGKRSKEVYRGFSDLQILRRERDNRRFLATVLMGFGFAVAYAIGAFGDNRILPLFPVLSVLAVGIMQKLHKIDALMDKYFDANKSVAP